MSAKIYVGNLPFSIRNNELKELFSQFGDVEEAIVIMERPGRSKGFGFVTFTDPESMKKAIEAMNDKEVEGRKLKVNEARPREE
jgi:RNA recognition motif-containing protein